MSKSNTNANVGKRELSRVMASLGRIGGKSRSIAKVEAVKRNLERANAARREPIAA